MKKYWVVLLGSGLLMACLHQEPINVDQDQIWTDFKLIYDAHLDQSFIQAQFRFDHASGSVLRITESASVRFNDTPLSFHEQLSAYTLNIEGKINQGILIFIDADQREFRNEINLTAPIELPDIIEINKSADLAVSWLGDPVGTNQEVKLIKTKSGGENYDLAVQSTTNSLSLTVPQNIIAEFTETHVDLMIDRVYHFPMMNGTTAGGQLTSIYRDCKFNVPLK